MKKIVTLFTLLFTCCLATAYACSICKITKNGKTIVGNNEDWTNPNSQIRFESKKQGNFGYMCVGFDDNLIQGAVNEAGLMFDAFAMPYKASKDTIKKRTVGDNEAIDTIMKTFSTVRQVRNYLASVDLSTLQRTMLVFIDKTGQYLRVESDEMFIENDSIQTFSNFYPSLTVDKTKADLPYYQNGCKILNRYIAKPTFEYCATVMEGFKQETTQYTTIYDLNNAKIRIFQSHNFSKYLDIDLRKELAKGNQTISMKKLFAKRMKTK
ncbi:MAG: hypothetical protein ABIN24_06445 [Dyadobacter sp.]